MGKVIVVGAGISGLSAAYGLMKKGCDVELFEKENRVGGVIQTLCEDGYLFEKGPNSFLDNAPDTLALCRDLNLENELLKQSLRANARYIFLNGALHNVPMGPGGLFSTKLMSRRTKQRLFTEIFRTSNRSREDESLASFVRRRFGDEILNNMVTPFVSGVYAGDPEKLSLRATFPFLYEAERNHGSLTGAGISKLFHRKKEEKKNKKPRAKNLCSFVDGMETMTQALADALGTRLHVGSPVAHIEPQAKGGYQVTIHGQGTRDAQAVVIATTAYGASMLLEPLLPRTAGYLNTIPYNALAVVGMGYPRQQIANECAGFGFLAPRNQGVRILGSIWNSSLFVRRAPGGCRSFSVFIGGGLDPTAIQLSDEEMLAQIRTDLKTSIGAQGDPTIQRVFRWERAIPQYPIGHVERMENFLEELSGKPGLFCIGNYVEGVSSNDCIRQAGQAAGNVEEFIRKSG